MNPRQPVIDAVLDQIRMDVENGDMTAIEELIRHLPLYALQGYLPEVDQSAQLFT